MLYHPDMKMTPFQARWRRFWQRFWWATITLGCIAVAILIMLAL